MALWLVTWLLFLLAAAAAITEEEYYQLPRLFELEEYEACAARPGAVYCLGSFQLTRGSNNHLMGLIDEYTRDPYHFNRTRIHRGLCVGGGCSRARGVSSAARFATCVRESTRAAYGLGARALTAPQCRAVGKRAPLDNAERGFAALVVLLLAVNLLATAYDLLRNKDSKPNRFLEAWSIRANWARLTATHDDGDPRLNALNPIHGIKAINMMLVMLAHSIIAYHISYLHNPRFLEVASRHPLSMVLHNGSVIVQTFVVLSTFLLGYHLLLHAQGEPRALSPALLPRVLLQRYFRITPVHLFVVCLAGTWWRRAGTGPLWPLAQAEGARCRQRWWLHALYLHNLVDADEKCLLQTWFLAVDMQLHVVAAALVFLLSRWPQHAPRALAALLLAAVAGNYAAARTWGLKPILYVTYPDLLREQYAGEASFKWLYTAPWGSLPAALLGLLLAAGYHRAQTDGIKLHDYLWFRVLSRLAVPGMLAAILAGGAVRGAVRDAALYAALDRPLFAALLALSLLGFLYRVDEVVCRLLSWRGWAVLARMSLSVLMLHWLFNITQVALATATAQASVLHIVGHWLVTMFLTYLSALPLHLLVEQPVYRFLRAFC